MDVRWIMWTFWPNNDSNLKKNIIQVDCLLWICAVVRWEDSLGFNLIWWPFDLCQCALDFLFKSSTFFFFSFFPLYFSASRIHNELAYGILLKSIFFALSVVNKMDECKLNEPKWWREEKKTHAHIATNYQTIQPFHQISSMKSSSNSSSSSGHHITWYSRFFIPWITLSKMLYAWFMDACISSTSLTQYII